MKHITLAVTELESGEPFNYRNQLINIAQNPILLPDGRGGLQPQGVLPDEMEKRLRLLKVLRPLSDGDVAAFEDADHTLLVSLLDQTRWGIASEALMAFIVAVREGADSLPQLGVSKNGHEDARQLVDVSA